MIVIATTVSIKSKKLQNVKTNFRGISKEDAVYLN